MKLGLELAEHESRIPAALLTLAAALLIPLPAAIAWAQTPCPGLHVRVLNIRNDIGTVDCALFSSSVGFPVDVMRSAMRLTAMKVPNARAHCDFEDLPAGTYALVILHDENMNGRIDTNWLGIPREGYGFSNNARSALGAPSFTDASFTYDGKSLDLTIALTY